MSKRFTKIMIVLLVLFAVIAFRLVWICVFDGEKYTKAALNKVASENEVIEAKRGDILDRNGVKLATSSRVYRLILDPKVILTDPEKYQAPTVAAIEKCFSIPADELNQKISDNPQSNYVILKKNMSYKEVSEFMSMLEESSLIKASLESESKRIYPYNTLACSVLGFEQDGVGQYGIEDEYNSELAGVNGNTYTYLNSENVLETVRKDAVDGCSVTCTIDYNVQTIVEKYIAMAKEHTQAKTVSVIVQNPDTGEIYAMADSDTYDANTPRDLTAYYTEEELDSFSDEQITDILSQKWRNFCVSQSFEPGSTFKPFTLAECLSEGIVSMDTTYNCTGSLTLDNRDIHCHNREGHGDINTRTAIAESCNVAMMTMVQELGKEKFCSAQRMFGFGQLTGIDLPHEMSCATLIYKPDTMNVVDLATNSFGQNFNATMIQMSSAFCSLINGGSYYKPYVVKNIYNADGKIIESNEKTLEEITVSKDVSDKIKDALRAVVTEGTGISAQVSGYQVAGKTGTAQKYDSTVEIDEEGNTVAKMEDRYVVSFLGFAPLENPKVVCYVVLDEPETGEDSNPSSELFSAIMSEILPYLNVAPDGEPVEGLWNYYLEAQAVGEADAAGEAVPAEEAQEAGEIAPQEDGQEAGEIAPQEDGQEAEETAPQEDGQEAGEIVPQEGEAVQEETPAP